MKISLYKALIVTILFSYTNIAEAKSWKANISGPFDGMTYGNMSIVQNEFELTFSCNNHDGPKYRLKVELGSSNLPTLPLYGQDEPARLSFLFTLHEGVLVRELWKAKWFNNGRGTETWIGEIGTGAGRLNALSRAVKLDLIDQKGKLISSFGTKGTSAAIAKLRQACHYKR
ncbi:hypothetical protein [Cohaesibacter gelatinilyticus]|uniref:Uncharacterized protein n=1 Tax=Cohaesibacter gelatinilyticus TaxID=372072 RepID=A0A285PH69_9HYPH|nr:hypothetical protein [Cohaesibacter gelatinilyticus]SNZ21065.1 hypothetical protein SAMN06265368_4179 [Cohaesibacter gelatinilyticus]